MDAKEDGIIAIVPAPDRGINERQLSFFEGSGVRWERSDDADDCATARRHGKGEGVLHCAREEGVGVGEE